MGKNLPVFTSCLANYIKGCVMPSPFILLLSCAEKQSRPFRINLFLTIAASGKISMYFFPRWFSAGPQHSEYFTNKKHFYLKTQNWLAFIWHLIESCSHEVLCPVSNYSRFLQQLLVFTIADNGISFETYLHHCCRHLRLFLFAWLNDTVSAYLLYVKE